MPKEGIIELQRALITWNDESASTPLYRAMLLGNARAVFVTAWSQSDQASRLTIPVMDVWAIIEMCGFLLSLKEMLRVVTG